MPSPLRKRKRDEAMENLQALSSWGVKQLQSAVQATAGRVLPPAWRHDEATNARNLGHLRGFVLQEVLQDSDPSYIVLLGRFSFQPEEEKAIVVFKASPVPAAKLIETLSSISLKHKSDSGAEYAYYDAVCKGVAAGEYSCDVIAPASDRQVAKHRSVELVMVQESKEDYEAVTLPYVNSVVQGDSLKWVANIVSKESEVERLLVDDPDPDHGFIINIDTKWRTHPDPKTVPREEWKGHAATQDLYCLGISRRPIPSLRDLRGEHLPMLREMLSQGVEMIERVYGVKKRHLRIGFHYHPQFFWLHVHFMRVSNYIGAEAERFHLLSDVIQNLEKDAFAYRDRTMSLRLPSSNALLKALEERHGS